MTHLVGPRGAKLKWVVSDTMIGVDHDVPRGYQLGARQYDAIFIRTKPLSDKRLYQRPTEVSRVVAAVIGRILLEKQEAFPHTRTHKNAGLKYPFTESNDCKKKCLTRGGGGLWSKILHKTPLVQFFFCLWHKGTSPETKGVSVWTSLVF